MSGRQHNCVCIVTHDSPGHRGGTAIPARSDSVGKMSTNSTNEVDLPTLPIPGHEIMSAVCVASSKLVTLQKMPCSPS
jgi:hypothetical protein